jgi:hypothetical protein
VKNKILIIITFVLGLCLANSFAQTDTIPPATPSNVIGIGYEKHNTVDWFHNTEPDLAGYKIYTRAGSTFAFLLNISKEKSFYTDAVPIIGLTRYYKVSAYDLSGNESPLSDSVACTSHSMNDEEFLDMVQRATFRYFYDYGHPVSGLSRERLNSGETVTSGGSGFGVMVLLVGIERGYISREEGINRMLKILTFLNYTADRVHGAFSHWLNGTSGNVIPFSTYDNGGDLVETSYMIQGLFAVRQYFTGQSAGEDSIRSLSTQIIDDVEWSWYRRYTSSNYLYWHWSPNYAFQMNMTVQGPNEAMIVYLLGIASTTYGVPASMYHNGWAISPYYVNGATFYGYKQWVGWDYGGPLFFSHYSFLGFDPREKKDAYCNYFENNKNITLIHKAYCTANPHNYTGYGENSWGLTASDDPTGYRVHEPNNDNGTITPSAALSSLAYIPQESIEVIKHFYRTYGSSVWGEYGFYDAFNPTQNWYADSYLAIDQGPIIVMIENYRSGLLWNLFMANPEVQPMLDAIGFVPDSTTGVDDENYSVNEFNLIGNYPNPFNPNTTIIFNLPAKENVSVVVYDQLGAQIKVIVNQELPAGENKIIWNGLNDNDKSVSSGIYLYKINSDSKSLYGKMILQK